MHGLRVETKIETNMIQSLHALRVESYMYPISKSPLRDFSPSLREKNFSPLKPQIKKLWKFAARDKNVNNKIIKLEIQINKYCI
jgi:hypothetical protein